MFQGLGKPGYYLFNFALLMIFYGACIGTMIVMTDFMASLPIMTSHPTGKRYLMQVLLTVAAILLCLLKDPGVLVRISSLGLVALVVSFALLFVYCFAYGSFRWDPRCLLPLSLRDFLNNFGVFVYSLGITPLLFTQLVSTFLRFHVEAAAARVPRESRADRRRLAGGHRGHLRGRGRYAVSPVGRNRGGRAWERAAVAAVGPRVQHHHLGADDGVVRGELPAVSVDDPRDRGGELGRDDEQPRVHYQSQVRRVPRGGAAADFHGGRADSVF